MIKSDYAKGPQLVRTLGNGFMQFVSNCLLHMIGFRSEDTFPQRNDSAVGLSCLSTSLVSWDSNAKTFVDLKWWFRFAIAAKRVQRCVKKRSAFVSASCIETRIDVCCNLQDPTSDLYSIWLRHFFGQTRSFLMTSTKRVVHTIHTSPYRIIPIDLNFKVKSKACMAFSSYMKAAHGWRKHDDGNWPKAAHVKQSLKAMRQDPHVGPSKARSFFGM